MNRRIHFITIIAAIVLALLTGCVSRVAPHDAEIAAGLAELKTSHTKFFDELQRTAGTPDGEWLCYIAWYEDTRGRIAALRERSASHGVKDDPTSRSLELLDKSLTELEQVHALGLSSGQVPVLRTLFDTQLRMLIELESAKKQTAGGVSP